MQGQPSLDICPGDGGSASDHPAEKQKGAGLAGAQGSGRLSERATALPAVGGWMVQPRGDGLPMPQKVVLKLGLIPAPSGKDLPRVSCGLGRGGASSAGSCRVTGPLCAPHWL